LARKTTFFLQADIWMAAEAAIQRTADRAESLEARQTQTPTPPAAIAALQPSVHWTTGGSSPGATRRPPAAGASPYPDADGTSQTWSCCGSLVFKPPVAATVIVVIQLA
jgi:hypothetical protein